MAKRVATSRLLSARPYTVEELCKILGVSRALVRTWIKDGLRTVSDGQPCLIRGEDIKAHLQKCKASTRKTMGPGEFRCQRCKSGRKPAGSMVDCVINTNGTATLSALCDTCGTAMTRFFGAREIENLKSIFDLRLCAGSRD